MPPHSDRWRISPELVREQTVEIAKLHHEQGLNATEILERLPERLRPSSTRTVYRRLGQAPQYLDIKVTPKVPLPATSPIRLDSDLARTLVAELGLADALVLQSAAADNDDDDAHSRFGVVAAHYAAGQVGDHDIIGVGSGRGVWHCINEMDSQERLKKLTGLKVVSLGGAQSHWGPLARLDADVNADQLARILSLPSTAVRATNLPLSIPQLGPKQREGVVKEIAPQLSDDGWEFDDPPWNRPPGVLIVGLGVLSPVYPFGDSSGSTMRGIEEYLVELRRDYLDSVSVAVVEHNLIPLRDLRVNRPPADELLQLLTRINPLTFKVGLDKLNGARVRVLIAGGPRKRPGLVLALGDPDFPFRATCLVTDDVTAREVLDYVREVRHQG